MTEPEDRREPPEATMDGAGFEAARPPALLGVGGLERASVLSLVVLGGCMFFDAVDRCLDRGGRWNDATGACELHE